MSDQYILSDTIVFEPKPIAVPYNYRISYRMAQLLLIIHYCCTPRSGCSLIKINIISNILSTNENAGKYFSGKSNCVVRFDPVVTRSLNFAIAEGLIIQQKNGKYKLSEVGKKYTNEIVGQTDLMTREKDILKRISTTITEEKIKGIMSDWRYGYVKNK